MLDVGCLPGLSGLYLLSNARTRSVSAENPTGEKGGGARAEPQAGSPAARLGKGWKVRPCLEHIPAGGTVTLADLRGPGVIQHIWITTDVKVYRDGVLRFYWDEEPHPSVEVPVGDFFANGHGMRYGVNSLPVCVNPSGGFNCYWPMPFRKRARVTFENQHRDELPFLFYQITYAETDIGEAAATFHAQWRRSLTSRQRPEHVLVDDIRGKGHYVGTHLSWTQLSDGWWGEGEFKFYIDGDEEYPTICGTGTEDYFGGAWCFGETYSTPFLGYPLWRKEPGSVPKHAMYRWHILDPIRFERDLRVTVQALGWWPDHTFQPLTDDIASVAYWYQSEPHVPFPPLPPPQVRWPR